MRTKVVFLVVLLAIFGIAIYPSSQDVTIKYIDRTDGVEKVEKVYGEAWLAWLYNNPVGELVTTSIVKRKFLSDWYGAQMDKPSSKEKIAGFVKNYNIDLSICKKKNIS